MREADALAALRVDEDDARRVLEVVGLRLHAVALPHRRELRPRPEQEAGPAGHPSLVEEAARARLGVVGRIDGDREQRDVGLRVVERAAHLVDERGARVLAGRVHERDRERPAAVVGHRHPLAVLVAEREVGRGRAGRADEAGPAGGPDRDAVRAVVAARGDEHAGHRGGGAQRQREQGVGEPRAASATSLVRRGPRSGHRPRVRGFVTNETIAGAGVASTPVAGALDAYATAMDSDDGGAGRNRARTSRARPGRLRRPGQRDRGRELPRRHPAVRVGHRRRGQPGDPGLREPVQRGTGTERHVQG